MRKNDNGVPEDEENFEEAIKNVNTALNPTKVNWESFPLISVDSFFCRLLPVLLHDRP